MEMGHDMAEKILVIDDTPVIRELLKEFFGDAGSEVDTAVNGREGYDMAIAEDYDLIICDVHMPEMNGFEMVVNLRQTKPESKIIIMDSLPGKDAKKATDAGAIVCLAKPFDLDELRKLVKEIRITKTSTI